MKKRIKKIYYLSVVILSLSAFSCTDVMDVNDTSKLSDQAVWSTEAATERYVTAAYKTITDMSQVFNSRSQYYDSYSDLMKSTDWDSYAPYNRALMRANEFGTGSAGPLECWTDAYTRIRRANVLLDEMKRYGVGKYGEEWCDIRRAEVRLCRAFAYYRLIRIYGGVIIRTDVSGADGGLDDGANQANVHRARATEAECWDFVLSELQWAADHLPESWPPEWEGRATKITAYGFISRMALYARNWRVAVDAAEKVKELGGALAPDYAKVFQVNGGQDNSKEILFALYGLEKSVTHDYDRNNRPFGDVAVYNTTVLAEHAPTAELADMYEYQDGTSFSWSNWQLNHADPYTDREPRFHATIMYNRCQWEGREIQSYVGGTDGYIDFVQAGSTNGHTCTGYYLRKYLQEGYSDFVTYRSYQYDAVLRYAEVLLNKAEAYAQLGWAQYRDQALGALNEVRARVNLPPVNAPNTDEFMILLRKERCVELAGEGFRYWDLRRWKLAVGVINGKNAHGVKITRSGNTFTYENVDCDGGGTRVFLDKYYYFSLPASEIANNKLCENNPYW